MYSDPRDFLGDFVRLLSYNRRCSSPYAWNRWGPDGKPLAYAGREKYQFVGLRPFLNKHLVAAHCTAPDRREVVRATSYGEALSVATNSNHEHAKNLDTTCRETLKRHLERARYEPTKMGQFSYDSLTRYIVRRDPRAAVHLCLTWIGFATTYNKFLENFWKEVREYVRTGHCSKGLYIALEDVGGPQAYAWGREMEHVRPFAGMMSLISGSTVLRGSDQPIDFLLHTHLLRVKSQAGGLRQAAGKATPDQLIYKVFEELPA